MLMYETFLLFSHHELLMSCISEVAFLYFRNLDPLTETVSFLQMGLVSRETMVLYCLIKPLTPDT